MLTDCISFQDDAMLTANSPSLSDLENTKKKLLIELEDNSSQSNSGSTSLKNDLNNTFVAFSSIAVTTQSNHSSISQECSNADKDSKESVHNFIYHLTVNRTAN